MIEKLYAKNYKSFPKLELEIANINVLLGANSCGKSSITNLLLMLSQTADTVESYQSLFRLNGSKSSLGEAANIFPDKKIDEIITVGWSLADGIIERKRLTIPALFDSLEEYMRMAYIRIRRLEIINKNKNKNKNEYKIRVDERDSIIGAIEHISNYFMFLSAVDEKKSDAEGFKKTLFKHIRSFNKIIKQYSDEESFSAFKPISQNKLKDLIETLKVIDGYPSNEVGKKIEYQVSYNKALEECKLKQVIIFDALGSIIIKVTVSESKKIELYSEVISNELIQKYRLDIVRDLDESSLSLISNSSFKVNAENPFASYVQQIISTSCQTFLEQLAGTKINHVSPLRAFPQRYYLLEKSAQHSTLNANDGSQLAEILKNNPLILEQVNLLFKDFDLKISTAKTNDIIHRITVKQNNVTVELTDVGFGISQVLPILVQALLCPNDSITIIEQPEIHLHPRMQAWLTNAIVRMSTKDNKKFIIETHSDTIIKRLQLLMLDPDTKFNAGDLNLYHLERQINGHTSIKNVPLNDLGEISWPVGFMDQEIQDAIKLQELKVKKLRKNRELVNV